MKRHKNKINVKPDNTAEVYKGGDKYIKMS